LGVDAMSITSLYTRAHASAAITAVEEVVRGCGSDMPVTISLSVSPSRGALRNDWITRLNLPDGMTMGLNCCEGPGNLLPVAEIMADRYGPLHLAPSAGLPARDGTYPYGAEAWAEAVEQLAEQVPLVSIGACCGCTPDYAEQARSRIDS
ncbi:MAG: homocysteine S-methyltransferase family protein, partial [Thermoleophilia bacterium]|nr:homocysteine S-methyltransferase family protein [Thermoleophilia bacterium]